MTHSISYRRMLNKMGYYNYQNGLIYRHLNQEGGWDSHLEHCRSFILKSFERYKPEIVTVLGSGWLLELPMAEILEKARKVYLLDIVHPPDVIDQVGSLKNVELIEQDISGGLIQEIWQRTGRYSFFNKLRSLENMEIPEFKPGFDPGMIISLNLLTQLESLLVSYLRKRSAIEDEELYRFRSEIQKKHIDFLKRYKSVIISDYVEVVTARTGTVKTIPTLLTPLPDGQFKEEWTWNFDHTGADYYNSTSIMKVIALAI